MGGVSPSGLGDAGVPLRALLAAGAVVVAALWPLTWPEDRDDFPLTPYPMFADARPDADVVVRLAVADGDQGTVPLPTEATGHRHLTQAVRAIAQAVDEGRPERLCVELASWARDHGPEDLSTVRIVTAAFDGVRFLRSGEREPRVLVEHAACEVAP